MRIRPVGVRRGLITRLLRSDASAKSVNARVFGVVHQPIVEHHKAFADTPTLEINLQFESCGYIRIRNIRGNELLGKSDVGTTDAIFRNTLSVSLAVP